MNARIARATALPVDSVFLQRWSPRAFADSDIEESELHTLLEAARWAPSSFNSQPWRYLYATRGSSYWETYVGLLMEFNAMWAANAAALVFIVSDTQTKDSAGHWKLSASHSFDAGASWASLALQATMRGWQAHAMAGIYHDRVRQALQVPGFYRVEAAVAIGRPGDPSMLPEKLRVREYPTLRRPLAEIAFAGLFQPTHEDRERLDREP